MNLPKRVQQHKAESDAYAILIYKLKNLGIFRNFTENDYGIDFEIELVWNGQVLGKYFKAQVKSSRNLTIRKSDKVPRISGIKESTLYYWTELSYKSHVIVYAVDLDTEKIYLTRPIFWQAASLIDGKNTTKTISFMNTDFEEQLEEDWVLIFSRAYACSPDLQDILYNHKMALRLLQGFLVLYEGVFRYDLHLEIHEPELLQTFLEVCKILLSYSASDEIQLSEEEKSNLYEIGYWSERSGNSSPYEVSNFIAQIPLGALMPRLIVALKKYREVVLDSRYYWKTKNLHYLRLVYNTILLEHTDHDSLCDWSHNYDTYKYRGLEKQKHFSWII